MTCSVDLTVTNLVLVLVFIQAAKTAWKCFQKWKVEKMLEKWNKSSIKDKVILHTLWRCKPIPSISPYAMKLETYLRMAKIPYEVDTKDSKGPKGKIPWITYNGFHVADSHLCIQFLNKKFSVNLNKNANFEHLAVARACRIMLEDHMSWGIAQFRWVENSSAMSTLMKIPSAFKVAIYFLSGQVKGRMEQNGIGKHTPRQIYQMTEDDLRTVSTILGNKKFISGDTPCEEDCAVFGFLSQALWAMPGSSFERLVNGDLKNLKDYCVRIKQLYWPDWESCLDKS